MGFRSDVRYVWRMDDLDLDLRRHWAACNNAVLPGGRQRLLLAGQAVGWVTPAVATALGERDGALVAGNGAVDLPDLVSAAATLTTLGFCRHRGEAFDVRAMPDGPVLGTVDRGALPVFGLYALGVHLNGLVRRADGPWLWVARRAADKLLDPGKLDHLVAGGVSAGMTAWQTLVKEAAEEAALPAALVDQAISAGHLDYAMERAEGLRRDRLYIYDLWLPESFVPRPDDGEVAGFELWPLPDVLDRVRRTDDFKFNVNLVLIDLFRRFGLLG